jgi:hypothetical protein
MNKVASLGSTVVPAMSLNAYEGKDHEPNADCSYENSSSEIKHSNVSLANETSSSHISPATAGLMSFALGQSYLYENCYAPYPQMKMLVPSKGCGKRSFGGSDKTIRFHDCKSKKGVLQPIKRESEKICRNSPCTCGKMDANGKVLKYKNCCGK